VSTELARLQAGFAGLSKQMQMTQIQHCSSGQHQAYNNQLLAVNRLRDGYTKMKDGVATYMPGLNEMIQATGLMTVETVKSFLLRRHSQSLSCRPQGRSGPGN
jgi:hypothetical protein